MSRVFALDAVRCTQYQISAARTHGTSTFPGAKVAAVLNAHCGIAPDRAEFVAKYLRDSSVVEPVEMSLANATKGVKYRLKANRWSLWHRLVNEMKEAELQPVSWGYFWMLTGTGQYELQTADSCCCGICRSLGFDNYSELREIVESLHVALLKASNDMTGLPTRAALLRSINKEEEFRKGLFLTHLRSEDPCAHHCRTMLLTAFNDSRFCKPCVHGCANGAPPPETFPEFVMRTIGRKATKDDWNDICEVCSDEKAKGNVLKCTHCNVVAHPTCVQRAHWDIDKEKDWTCWTCVRDIDKQQHTSSCEECNVAYNIIVDIKLGINLLVFWESKSAGNGVGVGAAPLSLPPRSLQPRRATPGGSKRPASDVSSDDSSNNDELSSDDSSSCDEEVDGDEKAQPKAAIGSANRSGDGTCSGSRRATASELLVARLEIADGTQLEYHAHLVRDNN